ncbi:MAG: RNA-binding transcriptional accessory protein [Clostridia bacterium]|nr:RNA-binding transcriptional accessory protein [Clostridia bacterium]
MNIAVKLAQELNLHTDHVENVISLLDEGNTVPFIARYRKEMHGTMDDQVIRQLADRLAYLRGLEKRKEEVIHAIDEQGKLTPALKASIEKAEALTEVEDLYLPYRPKRKTRASVAREKGLEALAQQLRQGSNQPAERLAQAFVSADKDLPTAQDALQGALDILAEDCSVDAPLRAHLRALLRSTGELTALGKDAQDTVYAQYADFHSPIRRLQSHQILALNRGEREKILKIDIICDEDAAVQLISRSVFRKPHPYETELASMASDAWKRLLFPSLSRELRKELTDDANEQAISTFALNLRPLLMQPPMKNNVTLGFDPAYRTGCKLAVVDETGAVLDTAVIYPTPPHSKTEESMQKLEALCRKHHVTRAALGNGTASRESEQFLTDFIRKTGLPISYMVVSEAGASVYSASKLGAQEFPDYDVSLRSAVSIARRLQDPLAELVKIDPKAIGVGQYQHDMPQARLSQALDGVVEDCVNAVGIDLNTASPSLLEHIAGITPVIAKNITAYRQENGAFSSRKQLLKVSKLGPKAFEQCAGFLRVAESDEVLDHTAVHPESYPAAKMLLQLCGYTEADVKDHQLSDLNKRMKTIGKSELAKRCGIGIPTLTDIAEELQKPGRDPRDELPAPLLRSADIMTLDHLKPGMEVVGTVRNVCDFGAFVDIGVHEDGLVHISQLSNKFVKHPSDVVRVGDIVKAVVLSVDVNKKRIGLSMKQVKQ